MQQVLDLINWNAIFLAGIFYALFSKVWFADFLLGRIYQGAFREDYFTFAMKLRSSLIRFVAGMLIGFAIACIVVVADIGTLIGAVELGLLLSIIPCIASLVQLINKPGQTRKDILIEMGFQLLSIVAISFVVVVFSQRGLSIKTLMGTTPV